MVNFFPNRNRRSSTFDMKVGQCHLLEVTVQLRRRNRRNTKKSKRKKHSVVDDDDDWDWYNTNRNDIHEEMLELLERSVISRMFGTEIEEYYQRHYDYVIPPKNYDTDSIGSKNAARGKKRGTTTSGINSNTKRNKTKRKQASFGERSSRKIKNNKDDEEQEKDIFFAFGELIELAYRKEPINKMNESQTILFKPKEASLETKEEVSHTTTKKMKGSPDRIDAESEGHHHQQQQTEIIRFTGRQKISSKLLLWISPSEQYLQQQHQKRSTLELASSTKLDAIYEYRKEMIPISNLFRKPAGLSESSSSSSTTSESEDEDEEN